MIISVHAIFEISHVKMHVLIKDEETSFLVTEFTRTVLKLHNLNFLTKPVLIIKQYCILIPQYFWQQDFCIQLVEE